MTNVPAKICLAVGFADGYSVLLGRFFRLAFAPLERAKLVGR